MAKKANRSYLIKKLNTTFLPNPIPKYPQKATTVYRSYYLKQK